MLARLLLTATAVTSKIPIFGSLISIPFELIAKYSQMKVAHLNAIIA
jgi:hypothetical protein